MKFRAAAMVLVSFLMDLYYLAICCCYYLVVAINGSIHNTSHRYQWHLDQLSEFVHNQADNFRSKTYSLNLGN